MTEPTTPSVTTPQQRIDLRLFQGLHSGLPSELQPHAAFRGPAAGARQAAPAQASAARPAAQSASRGGHAGSARSLSNSMDPLRQPQDGAAEFLIEAHSRIAFMESHLLAEPVDARITGSTRSLARRLLGLNVAPASRRAPSQGDAQRKTPEATRAAARKPPVRPKVA
jgi:hypothetical protein